MTEQDNHTCEVYHFDLYGTREEKYNYLQSHDLNTVEWQQLNPQAPQFFFVPKDFSMQQEYEQGFKIDELMKVNTSGVKTHHDEELVSFIPFKTEYNQPYAYRPFDNRYINYDLKKVVRHRYEKMRHLLYGYYRDTERIVGHASERANKSTLGSVAHYPLPHSNGCATDALPFGYTNLSLVVCKQQSTFDFQHVFCTNLISDINSISLQSKEISYVFPLFLYSEEGSIETERRVNMDSAIMERILLGTRSSSPAHDNYPATNAGGDDRAPSENNALAIFDYIYGILHSPTYRAKYKEFLKVDFPRIPYLDALCEGQIGKTFATPADAFEHYRFYGERLRKLHLMEQNTMQTLADQYKDIATFPEAGSMVVEEVSLIAGGDDRAPNIDAGGDDRAPSVRINDTQYFANVPAAAWNFYIGGYQPAQKWLKDRKGRTLTFDDIQHYRQIITVLIETARLMAEI